MRSPAIAATPAYAWAAGMFLAAAALAQDTKTDVDTGLVIDYAQREDARRLDR